ncbi:hypothetical protein GA0074692_6743 [Micromonospora pallida]|uniref:Phage gp6-like head-tail connector protein n=1 Tax=Micromonospora pallida TaxID=145854 RepID=A0A1C6TNN3_9ACTN|nr:phage gp6-like head-tail connector protein [Micromonospora pallida]SCL43165.1 hypothetical protein GA0074692_6743 [Micromonospora pallida]
MASTLYATLPELKAARKITAEDDDQALTQALTAACRQIDRKTGRPPGAFALDDNATARTFGVVGRTTVDGLLLVDDIGDIADLVVESGTGSAWSPVTGYDTGPDNALATGQPITTLIAPPGGYWAGPRVRVTARWGWPAVPDEISRAALLLANRLYMRKDSPGGVVGSAEWGAVRLSRWDPDVEELVGPYVLPGFA